jgi:hypothetical protein
MKMQYYEKMVNELKKENFNLKRGKKNDTKIKS